MEIVLQNIGKQFKNGTRALDHVTFTIPQGEFVSVIGPSGAGNHPVPDLKRHGDAGGRGCPF